MLVVYVAGAYGADAAYKIKKNIYRADLLSMEIIERFGKVGQGVMTICPHTNTQNFEGLQDDQWFYDATLELLKRSDVCIHVAGDQYRSKGTKAEIQYCTDNNKPVFKGNPAGFERFSKWLKTQQ